MDKINGQKLLPPSKALTVSQKKLNFAQLVPYKNIKQSSSEKVKKEDKKVTPKKETLLGNVITIKRTVLKIEKLLGSRNALIIKQKKIVEREDRDKKRKEREEKLEQKKESKNLDGKTPNIPGVGIVDYIKNFLKWVIIGRAFMLFSKFIPNIISFAKNFKFIYDIFKTITGVVFDGLVGFIEWSDKAGKKLREIAGSLGGEPFQKSFDNFSGALTTFMNLALIAGMATMGGSDLGVGDALDGGKSGYKNSYGGGKRGLDGDFKRGKFTGYVRGFGVSDTAGQGFNLWKQRGTLEGGFKKSQNDIMKRYFQKYGRKAATNRFGQESIKGLGGRYGRSGVTNLARKGAVSVLGKGGAKTALKLIKPLVKRLPIIGGLIDFGLSVALGENPGRAAFGAIGGTLLGVIGGALGGPFAAFTAIGGGMLGDWAGRKLYDAFFSNKPPSKTKPQKKRAGGSIKPKTGKPVKTKRTVPNQQKVKRPFKVKPRKTDPGKDVGGPDRVKRLFPDTGKRFITKTEYENWKASTGSSKTYNEYLVSERQSEGKRPNPFKALTQVSEAFKKTPLVGGIMGAAIDAALGQKTDKSVYQTISSGINFLSQTLFNRQMEISVGFIRDNLNAFAEGGQIPSRELVSMRRTDYADMIESVLGKDIEKRINEALGIIRKESSRTSKSESGDGGDGDGADGTPGANLRDGSSAEIEADLLEYFTVLYGKNAAIGVVANLRRESGYRTKTPDNKIYEGMAQWDRVDRWPRFVKWAEGKGLDPYSRNAQAQYIAVELKQLGTDNRLKKVKTPEEAASLFYNEFERGAYSKPVKGNQYDPDNPHENKNKGFIQDITKRNPNVGKRADKVIVGPAVTEAMVTGGLKPSEIPVTSPQGWRWGKMHKGIDLDGGDGAPISSAQDAQVIFAGDTGGGYGNEVVLRYSNGVETRFAHLKSFGVKTGQSIKAGQLIGKQGNTGSSTASHLHFEYYPNGGARTYEGYGDAFSVKDSYFRYGGNVKPKVSPVPLSSPDIEPTQSSSNPNIINASGMALANLNERVKNLKTGQKIVFNQVGSVQMGKGWMGGSQIKYYDVKGSPISKEDFDKRLQSSEVYNQMRSNDRKVQNLQGGGSVNLNYKNVNKPNMISDYDPLDEIEEVIYIQPIIIKEEVPIAQQKTMMFPGNTSLNSISAKSVSLSR